MTLRPVLAGDPVTLPSVDKDGSRGGYSRKPAPTNGYAWEDGDRCGFLPELEYQVVGKGMSRLKRSRAQPKRRGRR